MRKVRWIEDGNRLCTNYKARIDFLKRKVSRSDPGDNNENSLAASRNLIKY